MTLIGKYLSMNMPTDMDKYIASTPVAAQTGKFFLLLGVIIGIALFAVDPRASVPSPGFVLATLGIVLWCIGMLQKVLWTRHPTRSI